MDTMSSDANPSATPAPQPAPDRGAVQPMGPAQDEAPGGAPQPAPPGAPLPPPCLLQTREALALLNRRLRWSAIEQINFVRFILF
jgi:hypothetical protein